MLRFGIWERVGVLKSVSSIDDLSRRKHAVYFDKELTHFGCEQWGRRRRGEGKEGTTAPRVAVTAATGEVPAFQGVQERRWFCALLVRVRLWLCVCFPPLRAPFGTGTLVPGT